MKKLSLITIALICVAVAVSSTDKEEKAERIYSDTAQNNMLWPVHKRKGEAGGVKGNLNFHSDNKQFALILN